MNFNQIISNPIFFGIIVGICMLILTYLDSKISKKERSKATYVKIFLASGFTSGVLKFFVSTINFPKNAKILDDENSSSDNVSNIVEKIKKTKKVYTDIPDF